MSAIEKLEAVKEIFKILGYDFTNVTVSEAFDYFDMLNNSIKNDAVKVMK